MVDALRLYVLIGAPRFASPAEPELASGMAVDGPKPELAPRPTDIGPEPDPADVDAVAALTRAAIEGGATMLQLRAKGRPTRDLLAFARAMLALSRPAGVPLLINDRVDVARTVGADGVHLGPDDLPLEAARTLLGPDAIIGYSAGTVAEARAAARRGASYLGVGDVFGTATKLDADAPIGLSGLSAVVGASALPAVAIGGIGEDNAAAAIAAGASGVAVVSAVTGAPDPRAAARRLRAIVDGALAERNEDEATKQSMAIDGAPADDSPEPATEPETSLSSLDRTRS